jgi:hypothetical protein
MPDSATGERYESLNRYLVDRETNEIRIESFVAPRTFDQP